MSSRFSVGVGKVLGGVWGRFFVGVTGGSGGGVARLWGAWGSLGVAFEGALGLASTLGIEVAGGGGRWRADMASGGEGFGTERARLAGDGLSTERARLAQGGYRGKALAQNVQD